MVIRNKKCIRNNEGVSPVIGVILMVAITVVMAAIVSSWSTGVKAPNTPTTVGLDITRYGTMVSVLITSIDPVSAAPLPLLNISYQNWSGSSFNTNNTNMTNGNVGNIIEIETNNFTSKRVIISATYKDNSKKVLFSRDV